MEDSLRHPVKLEILLLHFFLDSFLSLHEFLAWTPLVLALKN